MAEKTIISRAFFTVKIQHFFFWILLNVFNEVCQ